MVVNKKEGRKSRGRIHNNTDFLTVKVEVVFHFVWKYEIRNAKPPAVDALEDEGYNRDDAAAGAGHSPRDLLVL
jgi:hypothetical protein